MDTAETISSTQEDAKPTRARRRKSQCADSHSTACNIECILCGRAPVERLNTEKELEARGFGSRTKLARDRQQGIGIPFIYVGRAVRYRESDVKKWLDANTNTHALQRGGKHDS